MEKRILTCIGCPLGCSLTAEKWNEDWEISGYTCKRGLEYAQKELTCPQRTVTSTVRVSSGKARVDRWGYPQGCHLCRDGGHQRNRGPGTHRHR